MKALQITKYDDLNKSLSFNEVDKPSIEPNEVLIEVKAMSLNPVDFKLAEGKLKDMVNLNLPTTIGFDVSGKIVEKGTEVTGFEVGDEVYSRVPHDHMGTATELVTVTDEYIAKKPSNISFDEAAGLPLVGLTAIQALESVDIKANDKVLIHAGSGGVGSFAVQFAKSKGAYVYTTTSSKNVDWVTSLGADRVIDYKEEDYKSIAKDVDIVFDTLGDDYTNEAFEIIVEGGRVTSIVGPPDEDTASQMGMNDYQLPEELAELIDKKSATYKFIWMNPNRPQLNEITELVDSGKIKPIVDQVYSFDEAKEAYQHLATGRAKGKVIVSLS